VGVIAVLSPFEQTDLPCPPGAVLRLNAKEDAVAQVNDPKSGSWQELYQAALLERGPQKLAEMVSAAEEAIFRRAQELTDSAANDQERTAMAEAAQKLLNIKTEKLRWPAI
jgi:hypothetical protein